MTDLLTKPFAIGLELGLLLTVTVFIFNWVRNRALTKENQSLKEHIHIKTTIDAKGNQKIIQEVEALKKQNGNLRISLATLKNKPNKTELQTLYLYDNAIHLMYEKAPGFAPVWENIIKEAKANQAKVDSGIIPWIRKFIAPNNTPNIKQLEEISTDYEITNDK